MSRNLRLRFWMEVYLAPATGVLAIVTVIWHDWIEVVFGADPDKGNGLVEWLAVATLVIVTVALSAGALLEWHRALLAERLCMGSEGLSMNSAPPPGSQRQEPEPVRIRLPGFITEMRWG